MELRYLQNFYTLIKGDELTKAIYEALLQSSVFFDGGISMEGLVRSTGKSRLDNIPAGHVLKSCGGRKKIYKLNLPIA